MIDRTLSHYKVLEEISRGGMGIVYKALDLKLNREVALKVLPPELVSNPDRKRRFAQEAQADSPRKSETSRTIFFLPQRDRSGKRAQRCRRAGPRCPATSVSLPSENTIDLTADLSGGKHVAMDVDVQQPAVEHVSLLFGKRA